MTLTKDQLHARNLFEDWFTNTVNVHSFARIPNSPSSQKVTLLHSEMIIKAGAGCGKSHLLIKEFIPYLQSKRYHNFALVTTTHQASASLSKIASDVEVKVDTLHRFLGCIPTESEDQKRWNPKQFAKVPYKMTYGTNHPQSNLELLIIDEAFRLDTTMINILNYYLPHTYFLFIGDPYQTYPIGETKNTLEEMYKDTSFVATLHTSPRFSNSVDIGMLTNLLMESVRFNEENFKELLPKENTNNIKLVDKYSIKVAIDNIVKNHEMIDYTNFCILTSIRNKVAAYNSYIIKERAKSNQNIIYKGESVEVAYEIGNYDVLSNHPNIRTNGFPFHVSKASSSHAKQQLADHFRNPVTGLLNHRAVSATIRDLGLITHFEGRTIFVLLSASTDVVVSSKTLSNLWSFCHSTGLAIMLYKPSFAKTVHMAQGITCENVYLDLPTIMQWRDDDMVRRLIYTGVSRCSKSLYLLRE